MMGDSGGASIGGASTSGIPSGGFLSGWAFIEVHPSIENLLGALATLMEQQ